MLKVKWVVLTTILASGISPVVAQDYPCDVYLRSAKIYLNRSTPDLESAMKNLTDGYQKCYNDPVLHELLGRIYAEKNQLEKMAEEFRIAKQLGHPKPEEMNKVLESKWGQSFQNGANTLAQADAAVTDSLRNNLYEQAAKSFEACIMIDSSRYQPYVNAAAQWISLNRAERADTLLAKAYQLAPESLNVVLSYGINLYNLEKYDQAIQIFEKAIKIDPNNREALINLASLYGLKNDRKRSMEMWDVLIEKGMADKDVYFNRGFVFLAEAEELVRKHQELEDSLQKNPKSAALKAELDSLTGAKKEVLPMAHEDFKKSVELDTADVEALYYFGYVQMLQEDLDNAMKTLERVKAMNPEHKSAWARLAIIYTMRGMKDKAKEADEKSRN